MKTSFRNRFVAASPLGAAPADISSQEDPSDEGILDEPDAAVGRPMQNLGNTRFLNLDNDFCADASEEGASIYGGIASAVHTPQIPAFLPEQSPPETPQKAASPVGWSPSLQSVLDEPPSYFAFRVMVGGMAFCAAFAVWAWVGQIEEVGQARGQLVPQGEVYKINPVELGKVANVPVKEGEPVKAGAVLVELDTQMANGEVQRLEEQLKSYAVELSQKQTLREKALLEAGTREAIAQAEIAAQKAALAAAEEKAATTAQLLDQLDSQAAAHQARIDRLQPLLAANQELQTQLQAEAKAASARLHRLEPLAGTNEELQAQLQADVDAAQERVERLKPLVEQGAIAKDLLDQAEQTLRDRISAITKNELQEGTSFKEQIFQAEQSLSQATRAITQSQLQEGTNLKEQLFQAEQAWRDSQRSMTQTEGEAEQAKAEADRLSAMLLSKEAEARRTQIESQQQIQQLEVELTQFKAKIAETQTLLSSAKAKLKDRFLTAPVDGVLLSLNVTKPGEVVQPGQTVAEMAPMDAPLVLKASLPNPEAGFVKTGMDVKVKFDAYPYQDYGVVQGTVTAISPDAKPDEKLGAVYRVEVSLAPESLKGAGKTVVFKAGQTASADIVIRRRRIADVLLDPIKKLQKGGIDL
ncbi:MAG TPA: HlyD family efflux transporter periplasmic adaptor subunit [Oscillatoriaceae cyanobacterium M33_DOE_052]|uniref:HlyD family efflux transporter periplasmic adaptor subunit n=1 Tax=Planktothricoides sp. SpSt-374 TaxID=2282167 RepID=A0A7C3VS84_9CYAN|nr:HlyD family efflux transporter periplasmic adaptor subunit [Oscillatoriaceae cyanobacterium M33_DOE_052]